MANPPDDRKADRARGAQETASRATGGARPAEKSSNPRTQNTATNASAKASTHPQSLVSVPLPFTTLGRYTVLREIGRGGMGAVYLAEDTMLKRQVALKIPQFEPSKAEQMQARFLREAQMAAQLSHPNICQTYDVAVIDGQYVMTMEYIEGKTLAAYAKPNKLLDSRQVVTLVRKVALAVEAAHQKGMIHRDLKPGNIILCRPDPTRKMVEPKVMDFGLAKSIAGGDIELTKSGMIVGTACYMSKEQWSGKEGKLGATCDVFSLGVILYELLTGQLPYDVEDGEPPTSWLVKLMTEPQRRPSEHVPNVDAALERIVMKAIAIEPEHRYASMVEFAVALDDWSNRKPTSAGLAEQTITDLPFNFSEIASMPSAVSVKPRSRRKHSTAIPLWFKLAGGAAALLLVFSVVIWFRSGDAMVKVEVFSDDVEVTFQNETVKLADGSHSYRVTPGDHALHIKSGNVEFETDRFTLKKGQNPAVTVQIVEDEIVAKNGEAEVGRRQISSNSDGKKIANEGTEILLKVPEQGFAVTKGSFTVFTLPANPVPKEPYRVVIDMRLPGDVKSYYVSDLTVEIIGSDGYKQTFPYDKSTPIDKQTPVAVTTLAANGQEVAIDSSSSIDVVNNRVQIIVVVPGTQNLVKDRIKIRSMRLQEDHDLPLTLGQDGNPGK